MTDELELTSRTARTMSLALSVLAVTTLGSPAAVSAADDAETPAGIERLGVWFDAHPELETTPSSGWKPYNRERWFQSSRPAPVGVSAARLRQDVLDEARTRAAGLPRGAAWFAVGPTEFSGRCVSVDFHPTNPEIVYVGSAGGGLWKSPDGGDTWSTTTDDLPTLAVGAVCVLAWDPDVVLIGTGEGSGVGYVSAGKGIFGSGLLRSVDGGNTWNPTSISHDVPSAHGFSTIEDNPLTGTILAAANDGLWRSTDEGQNWTLVLTGGNFFDVKWKPGDADRVYVTKGRDPFVHSQVDNGVFVSDDDGLTFTLAGVGQPAGFQIAKTKIAVTPADPSVIYVHYVNAASFQTLGIYRSTDDGATWSLRNNSINMTGGQGFYNLVIAVDPDNASRVITGGVNLYTSNNGGLTYTNLNEFVPFGNGSVPHWDNHALVYEPGSSDKLWITTDGGPWRSIDDGDLWSPRRAGIMTYQFYDICVAQSDPFFAMGGTQDNGIPGRANETTWFHSTLIADGMVCNIDPANADIIYADWQGGNQVISVDGGQSWEANMDGISGAGPWLTPIGQDPQDGEHLYTTNNTGTYRTTTGGNPWEFVSSHRSRQWISMSPVDRDVIWTLDRTSGVRHTVNDGANWTRSFTAPDLSLSTKVHAHPLSRSTAFITFGGYATGGPHLVMTTDFGGTWQDVTGDFPDQPASTFVVDPQRPSDWYLGSDVGVWISTDGGASWLPHGIGLANALITDLEIRLADRKLVAGTYGRAMWETSLGEAVDVEDLATSPIRELMLDRPFPTPTRGPVTFRFAARAGAATLEIHDVRGRRVDLVTDDIRSDGVIRTTVWSPDAIADGVYFAVLRAGGKRITRKLTLTSR